MKDKGISKKRLTSRRGILAGLSVLLVALMVLAACGEAATATPEAMEEPTVAPEPTAVPDEPDDAPAPTAAPTSRMTLRPRLRLPDEPDDEDTGTGLRPRSEWTEENPATFEELEAEIEKYRGASFVFTSWGGAYQAAQRQAYIEPFVAKFGIEIVEEEPDVLRPDSGDGRDGQLQLARDGRRRPRTVGADRAWQPARARHERSRQPQPRRDCPNAIRRRRRHHLVDGAGLQHGCISQGRDHGLDCVLRQGQLPWTSERERRLQGQLVLRSSGP